MGLTGSEAVLKSSLIAAIQAGILADCGASPIAPNCINGLSQGIADAIIPHLTSNVQVDPGQTTIVTVLPHVPGGAAAGTGSVSTPGTIS